MWLNYHHSEITWFLVGFLFYAGLVNLGHGNFVEAIIDFVLVLINYAIYKKR
jgi:hypothetical protein